MRGILTQVQEWHVQMFAYLRDRHGKSVTVTADPSPESILEALARAGVDVASCRLAVGNEFSMAGQAIPFDASLALIPPVSGG